MEQCEMQQQEKVCAVCMFDFPRVWPGDFDCIVCHRALTLHMSKIWCSLHEIDRRTSLPFEPPDTVKWDEVNCRNTKGWPLLAIPLLSIFEIGPHTDASMFAFAIECTQNLFEFRNSSKSDCTASIESECNVNSLYPSIWHILFLNLRDVYITPHLLDFIERLDALTPIRQSICMQPVYPMISVLEIILIRSLDFRLAHWVCSRGIDPTRKYWYEKPSLDTNRRDKDDQNKSWILSVCPKIGDEIAVLDTEAIWMQATVVAVLSRHKVCVHYVGWNDSWNEWIFFPSDRIRAAHYLVEWNYTRNVLPPCQRSAGIRLYYPHCYRRANIFSGETLIGSDQSRIYAHMLKGWEEYKLWKKEAIFVVDKHLLVSVLTNIVSDFI